LIPASVSSTSFLGDSVGACTFKHVTVVFTNSGHTLRKGFPLITQQEEFMGAEEK
jgi:hypothetical protein